MEKAQPRRASTLHERVKGVLARSATSLHEAAKLPIYEDVSTDLCKRSLFVFPKTIWLRRACIQLINYKLFEWFMLVAILANCISLALDSNAPGYKDSQMGQNLQTADYVFLAIFTFEALVKILAMGLLFAPKTYLRDAWNVLDAVVIITGYLAFTSFGNYTAIRGVRALRPLRTITKIEEMRILVITLIQSLPMLGDVIILTMFYLAIFGATTVQLLMGVTRGRCAYPVFDGAEVANVTAPDGLLQLTGVTYVVPAEETGDVCRGPDTTSVVWYLNTTDGSYSSDGINLSWGARDCPWKTTDNPEQYPYGLFCTDYGNPDGYRAFDNILIGWLTVFQHMTLTDWTLIMYNTQDGLNWWTWLLHFTITVLGGLFMVNLVLAVLFLNFTKDTHNKGKEDGKGDEGSDGAPAELQDSDGEEEEEDLFGLDQDSSLAHQDEKQQQPQHVEPAAPPSGCWQGVVVHLCARLSASRQFEIFNIIVIVLNAIVLGLNWYPMPSSLDTATSYINYIFTGYFTLELCIRIIGVGAGPFFNEIMNWYDLTVTLGCLADMLIDILPGVESTFKGTLTTLRLLRIFRLARYWRDLHRLLGILSSSMLSAAYLTLLLLLFMFICGLLGMQLFGYKLSWCDTVDGSFQTCPPGEDCPSHYDCYITCDNTTVGTWFAVDGSPYGGQAYCESFTSSAAANDTGSTDGPVYLAHVGKPTVPRANFDDMFRAFVTTFQILTLDNWADVMHWSMIYITPWSAIYFVVVIVLGSFMILQLFLAILLENLDGMQDEEEGSKSKEGNPSFSKSSAVATLSATSAGVMDSKLSKIFTSSLFTPSKRSSKGLASTPDPNPHRGWRNRIVPINNITHTTTSEDGGGGGTLPLPPSASLAARGPGAAAAQPANGQAPSRAPTSGNMELPGAVAPAAPAAEGAEPAATAATHNQDHLLDSNHSNMSDVSQHGAHDGAADHPPAGAGQMHAGGGGGDLEPMRRAKSTVHFHGATAFPSERWAEGGASAGGGLLGSGASRAASHLLTSAFSVSNLGDAGSPGNEFQVTRRGVSITGARAASMANLMHAAATFKLSNSLTGYSLFIFGPQNPLRRALAEAVSHKYYEYVVIGLILGSSVFLALDDNNVDSSLSSPMVLGRVLYYADCFFAGSFCLEAIALIIVRGFAFNGSGSYVRSSWNLLDLFVAVSSLAVLVLEAFATSTNLVWLRGLRALRGLRMLRTATKLHGIRVVVTALFKVGPSLLKVLLVGMLFYYMFSVMAVSLLAGCMNACNDDNGVIDPYYVAPPGENINRTWCEAPDVTVSSSYYHTARNISVPEWTPSRSWTRGLTQFDNVVQGVWVLFQMASLESWSDVMYAASDTVAREIQPMRDENKYIAIFFILFTVIGSFFILNLIIGVSIDKFHEMKDESSGQSPLLTPEQQQWLNIQKLLAATQLETKYVPPANRFRRAVYDIIMHPRMDGFMMAVILLNILTMFLVHYNSGVDFENAISMANVVFTAIFATEMLGKWLAIGVGPYMQDAWNVFDFVIVGISILGVLLDYLSTSSVTFLPLLRIFRVVRIFKLIPRAKGLRALLQTLLWSLPAVVNVGSVLFLFMYIYAIIGMNLFGNIKYQDNLTRHANFGTFPTAMITEFRMMTGENWNSIMQEAMIREDCVQVTRTMWVLINPDDPATNTTVKAGQYLDPEDDADLISALPDDATDNQCTIAPILAVFYFCTFMILCTYLLLQLIIGIILDNIQATSDLDSMVISQDHIRAYIVAWEALDPYGSCYIMVTDLTMLLMEIPAPLGVMGLDRPNVRVQEIIMTVDIPNRGNRVHFLETLHALAGRVAGAELPAEEEFFVHEKLVKRLPKEDGIPKYTAAHVYAAIAVRGAVRGFMQRRKLQPLWASFGKEGEEGDAAAAAAAAAVAAADGSLRPAPLVLASAKSARLQLLQVQVPGMGLAGGPSSPGVLLTGRALSLHQPSPLRPSDKSSPNLAARSPVAGASVRGEVQPSPESSTAALDAAAVMRVHEALQPLESRLAENVDRAAVNRLNTGVKSGKVRAGPPSQLASPSGGNPLPSPSPTTPSPAAGAANMVPDEAMVIARAQALRAGLAAAGAQPPPRVSGNGGKQQQQQAPSGGAGSSQDGGATAAAAPASPTAAAAVAAGLSPLREDSVLGRPRLAPLRPVTTTLNGAVGRESSGGLSLSGASFSAGLAPLMPQASPKSTTGSGLGPLRGPGTLRPLSTLRDRPTLSTSNGGALPPLTPHQAEAHAAAAADAANAAPAPASARVQAPAAPLDGAAAAQAAAAEPAAPAAAPSAAGAEPGPAAAQPAGAGGAPQQAP